MYFSGPVIEKKLVYIYNIFVTIDNGNCKTNVYTRLNKVRFSKHIG